MSRHSTTLFAPIGAIELLEQRRLMSITLASWSDNSISTLSGQYSADLQYGADGTDPSYFEESLANSTSSSYGAVTWTTSSGALDSGWHAVSLSIDLTGSNSSTLSVNGGDNISLAGTGSSSTISYVTIRAAVQGSGMAMAWSNVNISFYHAGSVMESTSLATAPSVNTLNDNSGSPAESITKVTPDAGADKVVVTGYVRLQATASVAPYLNSNDIFGDVVVA